MYNFKRSVLVFYIKILDYPKFDAYCFVNYEELKVHLVLGKRASTVQQLHVNQYIPEAPKGSRRLLH
jgi:hypothetical protein